MEPAIEIDSGCQSNTACRGACDRHSPLRPEHRKPAEKDAGKPHGAVTIRPADIDYHDRILVPGWARPHTAIGAEPDGFGWVKVLWETPYDAGAFTMFEEGETVWRL